MKREIIVVNDFYKDPEAVVAYAKKLSYYSPFARNNLGSSEPEEMARATWLTSKFKKAADCPFKSSDTLIQTLEEIVGEEIDREHWNKDFPENPDGSITLPRPDMIDKSGPHRFDNLTPNATSCRWNCAFSVKLHEQPLGTGMHNHVRDAWSAVGMDGWTGLIYLNKDAPRDSGLKLMRNKYGNDFEWMTAPDRWQLMDDLGNIYNRLLLVRGWMPHAGGSGFGDSVENGRLFQTLFFKTKAIKNWEHVALSL